MGDANLDEIAEQELLNEAKRGAARASIYGALGWQKCPLKPTNKVFLQNILLSTLSAKRHRDSSPESESLKRRLIDDELKVHGFKRHVQTEKKLEHDNGESTTSFPCSGTLNRKDGKIEKLENNSWRRKSRYSNPISAEDLHPIRKDKQEQRSFKSSNSKHQKESREKRNKE